MGRGKSLTEYDKGQIDILKSNGKSMREIRIAIGRGENGKNVVRNYLRNKCGYGKKTSPGRFHTYSRREESLLIKEVANKKVSKTEAKRRLGLSGHRSTAYVTVKRSNYLRRTKRKGKLKLTEKHKIERLNWARENMCWTKEWRKVMFSDEKSLIWTVQMEINIIGLTFEMSQNLSERQAGGGGIMVWVGIGYGGKTNIVVI
jgi:hypothetical protein